MSENLDSGNKENNILIEFLVEDLKETGEHLRDTDRKLSLLIQIYAGAFVLIATLSVNGIIKIEEFVGVPGFALSVFLFFFTWWLFVYSLKSKELKVIYIRRMNFLRREMHILLKTKHKELPGFWTDVGDYVKTNKVGLDDLYPLALRWIIALFGVLSVYILDQVLCKYSLIRPLNVYYLIGVCFFVIVVVAVFTWIQTNKADESIKRKVESFKVSSEKQGDESEGKSLPEINNPKDKISSDQKNNLTKPRRGVKK
jgi:hypothetical protein